jgi:Domain of unknown function (DUF4276)
LSPKAGFVVVEGSTEEFFWLEVLGPHAETHGLYLRPFIVETHREASGRPFKGGTVLYPRLRRQLLQLLQIPKIEVVTTMLDLYGLGEDFPGFESGARTRGAQRADAFENALAADIGDGRFIPYLSVYEFEALVLASEQLHSIDILDTAEVKAVHRAVAHLAPEDINDGENTHPSARLKKVRGYDKAAHGWLVTQRAGLPALRARCPHFDSWVTRLEALAQAP